MSDPGAPAPDPFAEAHAVLEKIEAAVEADVAACEAKGEQILAVAVADLKAVLAKAESDVIGKAHATWHAIAALIAKAEAAI